MAAQRMGARSDHKLPEYSASCTSNRRRSRAAVTRARVCAVQKKRQAIRRGNAPSLPRRRTLFVASSSLRELVGERRKRWLSSTYLFHELYTGSHHLKVPDDAVRRTGSHQKRTKCCRANQKTTTAKVMPPTCISETKKYCRETTATHADILYGAVASGWRGVDTKIARKRGR